MIAGSFKNDMKMIRRMVFNRMALEDPFYPTNGSPVAKIMFVHRFIEREVDQAAPWWKRIIGD